MTAVCADALEMLVNVVEDRSKAVGTPLRANELRRREFATFGAARAFAERFLVVMANFARERLFPK